VHEHSANEGPRDPNEFGLGKVVRALREGLHHADLSAQQALSPARPRLGDFNLQNMPAPARKY